MNEEYYTILLVYHWHYTLYTGNEYNDTFSSLCDFITVWFPERAHSIVEHNNNEWNENEISSPTIQ